MATRKNAKTTKTTRTMKKTNRSKRNSSTSLFAKFTRNRKQFMLWVFVVLFAAVGVYYLAVSRAATDNDTVIFNFNDNLFDYTGTWNSSSSSSKFRGDDHYSSTAGSTYSYKFIGTKATLYATKDKHHGIAAVSIDGGSEKMVDLYSSSRSHQAVIFTSPELPSSSHTIRVRVTGNKSPSSSGTVVTADRLDVVSTLSSKRAAADVDAPPGKLLWKADFSEGKADLNPEVENDDGLLTFPTPSY